MNTKHSPSRITRHVWLTAAKAAMVIGMVIGGGRVGAAFAQSPRLTSPRELTSVNGIRTRLKRPPLSHVRQPQARRGYRGGVYASGIGKSLVNLDVLVRAGAFEPEIARAADRHGIDPRLLWCVAFNESRFVSRDGQGRPRMSPKGAAGLMQFVPATAARFRINPLDDRQAIHGAALYLRILLDRYRGDTQAALAAYNAGEGAVDAFRYGITVNRAGATPINRARLRTPDGLPPYRETRGYVRQALALWQAIDWRSRFTSAQLARTVASFGHATIGASGLRPATPQTTATPVILPPAPADVQPATQQATTKRTLFELPTTVDPLYEPRSILAARASDSARHDGREDAEPSRARDDSSLSEVTRAAANPSNARSRAVAKRQENEKLETHLNPLAEERPNVRASGAEVQRDSWVPQNTTPRSITARQPQSR